MNKPHSDFLHRKQSHRKRCVSGGHDAMDRNLRDFISELGAYSSGGSGQKVSEGDGELRSPVPEARVIKNKEAPELFFVCSKRLDETVGPRGKQFPAKFKTRKAAEQYCRELRLRKPPYHPGYYVEEQDVQQTEDIESTETLDFNP